MKRTVVEALSGARDIYRQMDTPIQSDTDRGDSGVGSGTASTLEEARCVLVSVNIYRPMIDRHKYFVMMTMSG